VSRFLRFDLNSLPAPEYSAPTPDRVISGEPSFTTWILEDTPKSHRYAGYWAATVGAWRVSYEEWEYCSLLEGKAIVTEDGQESVTLSSGDHFIFRPGFQGRWDVLEPVLKTFVVILPTS